jgi:uncharacterized protein (TIGR03435 family)
MKKLMLWIIALVLFSGAALLAQVQDITGTWQGTVRSPSGDLRAVIKISKANDGNLKAVLYSIDTGGDATEASAINLQGPNVKIQAANITYEGRLEAAGTSIIGTWTQGSESQSLILNRANSDTAWTIPGPPVRMAADADPAFEVATIKLSIPDRLGKGFGMKGHEFLTFNTSLSDLILFAYGLNAKQIAGGPDWLYNEKYDLTGKPDREGQPNSKQTKTMVQKLLADRFQLTFHREKKVLPSFAIVVAKSGPKLTKSGSDPKGDPGLNFPKLGFLVCQNASMSDLAALLQVSTLSRPVIDQTGLTGRYDFKLIWTPTEDQVVSFGVYSLPPPADNAELPPDLFTAMRDELGLRLITTKAPADVFVIDRAEKPSAN